MRKKFRRKPRKKDPHKGEYLALKTSCEWWERVSGDAKSIRKLIAVAGVIIGIVAGLEIVGYPLASQSVGFLLILYLPGWFFSLAVFPYSSPGVSTMQRPRRNSALDVIERTTFSVMLSIFITSGIVYLLHALEASSSELYRLTPRNFVYLMGATLLILGAVALYRQKIVSLLFMIVMMVIPFVVYGIHTIFGISLFPIFVIPEVLLLVFATIAVGSGIKGRK